ncbi:MAG: hypothetical protein WCF78_03090 [archaeon]
MIIRWSLHAQDRFCERALILGLNYGDIEYYIKEQKIKIKEKDNIKTIFNIDQFVLTAIKKETKDYIYVITLWEANEEEVKIWNMKKK